MSDNTQRTERETPAKKSDTGATASFWTVHQLLPGGYRKPVRLYMMENDMSLADVLAEALEEWAKAKNITLPPRNPYLAWAS